MRYFVTALFFLVFFTPVVSIEAANVYLDPSSKTIGKGESTVVTVRLDTTVEECINSIDGVLQLDPGLSVVDISTGNSIFSLWVEPPTIDEANRQVTFAGGIPNGYCGRVEGDPQLTNSLMELVVQAPSFSIGDTGVQPERKITFAETTNAYLNDGFGTIASLQTSGATISVQEAFSGDINEWKDKIEADTLPPKQFSITLTKDDSAFHGDYFIVFNTTDKQTGIDHYEVIEEPLHDFDFFGFGAATAPWVRATSPYVLTDQTLNSVIRVKALDKAGNEYITSIVPDESLRGFSKVQAALYFFVVLFSIVLLAVIWIAWHHFRKRDTDELYEDDEYFDEEEGEFDDEDEYVEKDEDNDEIYEK